MCRGRGEGGGQKEAVNNLAGLKLAKVCVGGGGGQNETVNNVAGLKLAKEVLGRGGGGCKGRRLTTLLA